MNKGTSCQFFVCFVFENILFTSTLHTMRRCVLKALMPYTFRGSFPFISWTEKTFWSLSRFSFLEFRDAIEFLSESYISWLLKQLRDKVRKVIMVIILERHLYIVSVPIKVLNAIHKLLKNFAIDKNMMLNLRLSI